MRGEAGFEASCSHEGGKIGACGHRFERREWASLGPFAAAITIKSQSAFCDEFKGANIEGHWHEVRKQHERSIRLPALSKENFDF